MVELTLGEEGFCDPYRGRHIVRLPFPVVSLRSTTG